MRLVYLVDNSVIQRVHRSRAVADALLSLLNTGDLAGCLPQALEEGYSARNLAEWEEINDSALRAKVFFAPNPEIAEIARQMQRALFAAGQGRAVGVSDLQIAATAVAYSNARQSVVVVHYDADFETLAALYPTLSTQWIVPRGTVD